MGISKQSLLGALLLLVGGGILTYAMLQNPEEPKKQLPDSTKTQTEQVETPDATDKNNGDDEVLTADIEEENKILDKKQKQREAQDKAEEAKAINFVKQKERAAATALAKAREENEAFQANRNKSNSSSGSSGGSKRAPKATETYSSEADFIKNSPKVAKQSSSAKSSQNRPKTYRVRKGDNLLKIAKRFAVPTLALAEANKMGLNDTLIAGDRIRIPKKAQERALVRKAKARERKQRIEERRRAQADAKRKARKEVERKAKQKQREEQRKRKEQQIVKSKQATRTADRKLAEARAEVRKENAKGTFGVQVALASNQEKANEIAKVFRKSGYKVKTSKTTRGVRVMVGPERGKKAAIALKNKINSDPRVKVADAWVLYWR